MYQLQLILISFLETVFLDLLFFCFSVDQLHSCGSGTSLSHHPRNSFHFSGVTALFLAFTSSFFLVYSFVLIEHIFQQLPERELYLFPRTVLTNDHKLSGLKQQKCILSPVLETRILSSRCRQGHAPSVTLGRNLPCFFLAPDGGHCYLERHCSHLCLCCHMCLCSNFPLLLRTPVLLVLGSTLLQYGLIITTYICDSLVPK